MQRQGYNLIHWTRSGMSYWAISDLNNVELHDFARLVRKASDELCPLWGIVRLIGEGAIKLLPLHTTAMRTSASLYHRHRFPVEIISHCVVFSLQPELSRCRRNVSDARRGSHLRNRQRMVPQVRSDLC